MNSIKLLATLSIVIISVGFVSGVVPAHAQGGTTPATNIRAFNGHNPSEVILTWSAVADATHYRIGCVNMDRDYPRAKATVTGNWREAMVYVDVEAQNLSANQPTYTLHGLQEGAYHACSVLTNNARYGQPTWPSNPAWQYLTVTDHGGSCPAFELSVAPDMSEPLSLAQLNQVVKPALVDITYVDSDGFITGGSGFIVRSDGLVITNRHVVDDRTTVTARVYIQDDEPVEFTGKILGKGILTDLAAVQLSSSLTFSTLELADSDAVAYGESVTAWGYPASTFLGSDPTLTEGIISSPHRIFEDTEYVQSNADTAGGSSGGPLIDAQGRVIGVNAFGLLTQLPDGSLSLVPGISLSVASNEVRDRLSTYEAGGPDTATYRNLRYDYGYGMDIPKGWFLDVESSQRLLWQRTEFSSYGEERGATIWTFRQFEPFLDHATEVSGVAGGFLNGILPILSEDWDYFEPVSLRQVEVAGQLSYRLEYLARYEEGDCIRSHVALISMSSDFPTNPFGFVAINSVCEDVLIRYSPERNAMLNSFRP